MRMALRGALAAIIGVGCAAAAQAQERKCEINAYTIDDDPQGINIRGGPSAQAKIVAVIKKRKKEDEVQVSIAAERDGWFRITEYSHFEVTKDVKVNGWLHGSRLAAGLMIMQGAKASERLYEEPSPQSKTLLLFTWDPGENAEKQQLIAELPGGKSEIIDYKKIKHAAEAVLLACTGDYVKVRVHKYVGWLPAGRLCGNPVTTCN